jgi:hypothetical protein
MRALMADDCDDVRLALERLRGRDMREIPAALLSEVAAFSGNEEKDERAVLAARVREAGA